MGCSLHTSLVSVAEAAVIVLCRVCCSSLLSVAGSCWCATPSVGVLLLMAGPFSTQQPVGHVQTVRRCNMSWVL